MSYVLCYGDIFIFLCCYFYLSFFTFWVVIGFIWTLIASFTTILFPVWESREGLYSLCEIFLISM